MDHYNRSLDTESSEEAVLEERRLKLLPQGRVEVNYVKKEKRKFPGAGESLSKGPGAGEAKRPICLKRRMRL